MNCKLEDLPTESFEDTTKNKNKKQKTKNKKINK